MNVATLLSCSASVLLFGVAATFLAISRAPGWERTRLYALIALSGALYAGFDTLFSLESASPEFVRLIAVGNFLFGALHACGWVLVAFSSAQRPWQDLGRPLRWIVGLTLALGVLAVVPGVATEPGYILVQVPALGAVYKQTNTSWFGAAFSGWLLLLLLLPFSRFVADARRGAPYALARVLGFAAFFACGAVEALVTNGLLDFFYLADVGLVSIVLALLVETLDRVIGDARALAQRGRDLAEQVSSRTLERDAAREALIVAERQAALGQLAAGVGHEINNPLTYVRANLEIVAEGLRRGGLSSDAQELLDDALIGTQQIQRVVTDLRAYAVPVAEHREPTRLQSSLESALKLASRELPLGTQLERRYEPVARVMADPVRLRQVLLNLIINAGLALREAKRSAPLLVLELRMSGAQELTLTLRDNGVGIEDAALARLGEPYFSTRLDRGGTGLGLFVARGIVESLGGALDFDSEWGVGTTARLRLPTIDAELEPHDANPPSTVPPPVAGASVTLPRKVLVVDDDPAVARALARQLGGAEIVHDGAAAVKRILSGPPLDLVLCDVMMAGESGQDVYEAVASERPELLRTLVFITGGATVPEVAEFLRRDGVRHLSKPLQREALLRLWQELSAAPRSFTAPEAGDGVVAPPRDE